jgi:hypothetical protein
MSVGSDLTLRVFGQVNFTPDGRGRTHPLANADVSLTAFETTTTGLQRIRAVTNPIVVTTDGRGRFDQRTDWGTIVNGVVGPLPEPDTFNVIVTDPDSGVMQSAGQVFSNGDDMWIDSHIAPDEEPLARTHNRHFSEIPELAGFLAEGLKDTGKLGEVILNRPFFEDTDNRNTSAAEKLFRHFANLLDRMQAVHL